jgi:hypothetical protein
MKTALKFKGGDFRFKPHFNQIEFEILGVEGRATGRLTLNDCLSLGKYLMDVYYSRAMRPGDGPEPPEADNSH